MVRIHMESVRCLHPVALPFFQIYFHIICRIVHRHHYFVILFHITFFPLLYMLASCNPSVWYTQTYHPLYSVNAYSQSAMSFLNSSNSSHPRTAVYSLYTPPHTSLNLQSVQISPCALIVLSI